MNASRRALDESIWAVRIAKPMTLMLQIQKNSPASGTRAYNHVIFIQVNNRTITNTIQIGRGSAFFSQQPNQECQRTVMNEMLSGAMVVAYTSLWHHDWCAKPHPVRWFREL